METIIFKIIFCVMLLLRLICTVVLFLYNGVKYCHEHYVRSAVILVFKTRFLNYILFTFEAESLYTLVI